MTEESTQALGGCQHRKEQQHTHVWGYWADCFSLCSHIFTIILHRLKEGGREGGREEENRPSSLHKADRNKQLMMMYKEGEPRVTAFMPFIPINRE